MRLAELQRLFLRAITWPTGVEDFLARADPQTRSMFHAAFQSTPGFDACARVGVYAESYYWRLEDVLREQFRVTAWACGDVEFHDLCTDFVLERPPGTQGDVRRVGEGFFAYVTDHAVAQRIPGIADVVRVEWAAVQAIDAPDGPLLRAQDLAEIPAAEWPALALRPAPGVALHTCRLPYAAMWRAREQNAPSPEIAPTPCDPPEVVLVWRRELEVFHRSVPAPEARALAAFVRQATFAEVCAATIEREHETPRADRVVSWLRRWLVDGLVAAP